jgi:hypothetical protein
MRYSEALLKFSFGPGVHPFGIAKIDNASTTKFPADDQVDMLGKMDKAADGCIEYVETEMYSAGFHVAGLRLAKSEGSRTPFEICARLWKSGLLRSTRVTRNRVLLWADDCNTNQ